MLRPKEGNSGFLFYDTLKFQAQDSMYRALSFG